MRSKTLKLCLAIFVHLIPIAALAQTHPNEARGFNAESVYDFHNVDSVNVFNGNLTVQIPIGSPFHVNGKLSYQFGLVYNSHAWQYDIVLTGGDPEFQPTTLWAAVPLKTCNAGMGWNLSLGEIRPSGGTGPIAYVDPSGAEHVFHGALHAETTGDLPPVTYTRDGTYIRRRMGTGVQYLDFPDGTVQQYTLLQPNNGTWTPTTTELNNKWRLTKISDRFNNEVNIEYRTETPYTEIWIVRDPARTINVSFLPGSGGLEKLLKDIDFPAPHGGRAHWTFNMVNKQMPLGLGQTTQPAGTTTIVPVLASIVPPEGNGWSMMANGSPAYSTDVLTPGVLTRLQLPTLGSIGWEYEVAEFAEGSEKARNPAVDQPSAVKARHTYDSAGTEIGLSTYGRMWGAKANCTYTCDSGHTTCPSGRSRQLTAWVTEPPSTQPDGTLGPKLTTITYYSAYENLLNPRGDSCPPNAITFNGNAPTLVSGEYALPLTRFEERDGRFLSTEVRSNVDFTAIYNSYGGIGRMPLDNGTILSSTWVRYDIDADGVGIHGGKTDFNRRVVSSATYFEDDLCGGPPTGGPGVDMDGCMVFNATNYFGFDGYGHFRQTSSDGNFPAPPGTPFDNSHANYKTTFTQYAPDLTSWLLEKPTETCTAYDTSPRSSAVNGCSDLGTASLIDLMSIDDHGVLVAKRTLSSPATADAHCGAWQGYTLCDNDILTRFIYNSGDHGNLSVEESYGGDIARSAATSSPFTGSTPEFSIQHDRTYTDGAVATLLSHYANGVVTADEEYDVPTSLVVTSRDGAGVPTTFHYDALGRLRTSTPQGEAVTTYDYDIAQATGTAFTPATIRMRKAAAGEGAVESHYQYDAFGRLWRTKSRLPDDTWSIVQRDYDKRGVVIATSTPQIFTTDNFVPDHKSQTGFDIFNRPSKAIAPDGSTVFTVRLGSRITVQTLDDPDNLFRGLLQPISVQYADAFGRLVRVEQPSGPTSVAEPTGAIVTTDYNYDVAGRLTDVFMHGPDANTGEDVVQNRHFSYDRRGFLATEQQPELGATGNGITNYVAESNASLSYDSHGHLHRKVTGQDQRQFDLRFTYDGAERLTKVESFDAAGNIRPIKEFTFADSNDLGSSPTDYRKGKVVNAVRHNYLPGIAGDVAVTETYHYANDAGRLSDRTTLVENVVNATRNTMQEFKQSFSYSTLGILNALDYPTCTANAPCAGSPATTKVDLPHYNGALTSIPGYVAGITYNPNGTVHTVTHGTASDPNVIDTYAPDPTGMTRPSSITFTGWQSCSLPPTLTINTASSVIAGTTGIAASAASDSTLTYAWSITGGTITSATNTPAITYTAGGSGTLTLTLRLTNTCGSTTINAYVTVNACSTMSIVTQPHNDFVASGATTTLSVVAAPAGTAFSYQWFEGQRDDTSHPVTQASTSGSSFTTPALTATKQYWVRVSVAGASCTESSVTATVTVCETAHITHAPPPQDIYLDKDGHATLSLNVTATGTNLTYAWYNGMTPAGPVIATTPFLTLSYGTGDVGIHKYTVAVNSGAAACPGQEAATVTVTVADCPLLRTNPPPVHPIFDVSPYTITLPQYNDAFNLTVSTNENVAGYTFQWYHGIGDDAQPVPNGNAYSITAYLTAPFDAYWCVVTKTGASGCVTSTPKAYARFTGTCPLPPLSVSPMSAKLLAGQQVTLAAKVDWPAVTYQWYRGSTGDTKDPIQAPEGQRSWYVADASPRTYWVRVTDECGTAHEDSGTIVVSYSLGGVPETVCTPIVIVKQPQSVDIAAGADTVLKVDANSIHPVTYSWFELDDAGVKHPIPGTDAQVTVHPTRTTRYVARVNAHPANQTCESVEWAETFPATVHVRSCSAINVTHQPANVMILAGASTTLSFTYTATENTSIQWFSGDNDDPSHPISGATLSSLVVSPAETASYWARISTASSCAVDTFSATVNVCHPPAFTSTWGDWAGTVVRGQSVTMYVNASGTNLTYQWYTGTPGDTSNPVGGGSWNALTVTPLNTTTYWVRVTGLCGTPLDSPASTITVCARPVITQQPQSTSVFSGQTTTLHVTATEATTTPLTYQWFQGVAPDASHPVGSSSPNFTTPALTQETKYWVAIQCTGLCAADPSDTATVSICVLPEVIPGPANQTIHYGQTAHVQLPPPSPPTGNTFRWFTGESGDLANSTPLGDFGPYDYIDPTLTATTKYWAQVKNGNCISRTPTITIYVCIPTITQHPAGTTINSGQTAQLSVTQNLPGATYQWYQGNSGNTSTQVGTNSPTFTTPSLTSTTSYWVRVTGCQSQYVDSNAATVTVCAPPVITQQPANAPAVNPYTSATLTVVATGTNVTYQWYVGASGDTNQPIQGATSASYAAAPPLSQRYWVRVSACGSSVNSNSAWISVYPTITAQPQATTYLSAGARGTLTVTAIGNDLHYQWCHAASGAPVAGAPDSPTFITPDINADGVGFFCNVISGATAVRASSVASFYLCDSGVYVAGLSVSGSGSCRTLTVTLSGTFDHVEWFTGPKGDTSHMFYSGDKITGVCPTSTTSYWARVYGYDSNAQMSCYSDTDAVVLP